MVEKSQIDFILVNSSCYIELESKYRVDRIATLKNNVFGKTQTSYGSVIFCKKQRQDIRHLIDLKRKAFRAVEDISFGGWIMTLRELKEAGVDAGTVRTGILEIMNAEGKINIDDFYIIHEHGGDQVSLPFLHSSREYPEWPIAKLEHVSNELSEKVAVALIGMPRNSIAALSANIAGWTIPLNYQSVHDCLKELKIGPYKGFGKISLRDIFRKYWILIFINFITLMILAWFLANHNNAQQKD